MWDLAALKKAHRRAHEEHEALEREAMREAGEAAALNVRTRSMFKRRSGANSLKDNTRHRIIRSGSGKILRLSWNKKHAGYMDHGTSPHEIRPRTCAFLRFYWPKVGRVVFMRRVHHPGTRPYHFGSLAQKAGYHHLGQRLRAGMNRIARRF